MLLQIPSRVADDDGITQATAAIKTPRSLRGAYTRRLHALPAGNLEREQRFSWPQALLSLFSYCLMLTDVFRTGIGIDRLPYRSLEPDAFAYFGPLAYVTTHLTTQNATANASLPFWTYKYDTTSMGMRTVAHFFSLQAWPVCVTYAQPCDESQGIPLPSVFAMVESIVHAVGSRAPDQAMTLRSHHAFKDRVYHYALPWFFNALKTRTTHAVHFAHPLPLHSICADRRVARRPYSCSQSWTNTRRLACEDETQCETLGVWDSIHARQQHLARAYADHDIDFVVLDAMEDFPRGSLTYQGRKDIDIVVLTRIRQCSAGHCETVAVDDYRYETATFVMNALDWYTIVGLLRVVGQAYVWLRLFSLVVGCAFARLGEPRFEQATFIARLIVSARTVFLIPSQVVVYGSSFPVSCYVLAHWIDSPAAYAMVQAYFTSLLGKMHWTLSDLLQHCAVSMRTVWVIGFICHRLLALATRTRWSPIHGVPGMAEFAITLIASLTIVAQFRALSFRRATVESVLEVVPSARRAQFRADRFDGTRSTLKKLVGGSPIDFQCLLCGFLCLLGISVLVGMLRRAFPRLLPLRFTLTSTTIAPYSAGMLWPRSRLVVSWNGPVANVEMESIKKTRFSQVRGKPALPTMTEVQRLHPTLTTDDRAMVLRETTASRLVQRDMQSIDRRPREIDATVFLMNVAAMTDPWTWLDLRVLDGKLIGFYEAKAGHVSRRCLLLPYGLETVDADIPIDWGTLELVVVVNTKDLAWRDLLRCGPFHALRPQALGIIFDRLEPSGISPPPPSHNATHVLFFDGGSRGNPGPGGSGACVVRVDAISGEPAIVWSATMSHAHRSTTNNQATYRGLITGLRAARHFQWSQLEARHLADQIGVRHWFHHVRAHNKMADALVDLAMGYRASSQVLHPSARSGHCGLSAILSTDLRPWMADAVSRHGTLSVAF